MGGGEHGGGEGGGGEMKGRRLAKIVQMCACIHLLVPFYGGRASKPLAIVWADTHVRGKEHRPSRRALLARTRWSNYVWSDASFFFARRSKKSDV